MNLSRSLPHLITSKSSTTWLSVLSKKTKPTFAIKNLRKWKSTEMPWKTPHTEKEVSMKTLSFSKWWDKEEWKKENAALELKWTCNTLTQTWEILLRTESDLLAILTLEASGAFIQHTIILIVSSIVSRTLLILSVHLSLKLEEKVIINFLLILIFTSQTFGNIQDLIFQTQSCLRERFKLLSKKVSSKAGMIQDFLL